MILDKHQRDHREKIEEAIRLLQSEGYTIFNSLAYRKLSVSTVQDAQMTASYSRDPNYANFVRRDHATKLAAELLKSDKLSFSVEMPTEEDIKQYGMRMDIRMTTRFGFFSHKDREWQR